jgi:DNA replication protein DnaC
MTLKTLTTLTLRRPIREHLPAKARDLESVANPIRKAIKACVEGSAKWPLFLFGPAGTGKTCAVLCLCDHVARSKFWTEETLVQQVTDAMMGRLHSSIGYPIFTGEIWRRVESAPVVAVDEIGARTVVSDHRYATLKTLLDLREGKPLALVSNVEPSELAAIYDDRIASRALCGTVVKAGGVDRRLAK